MWLWCERRSSTACFTAMLAPCPSMAGLCPGHSHVECGDDGRAEGPWVRVFPPLCPPLYLAHCIPRLSVGLFICLKSPSPSTMAQSVGRRDIHLSNTGCAHPRDRRVQTTAQLISVPCTGKRLGSPCECEYAIHSHHVGSCRVANGTETTWARIKRALLAVASIRICDGLLLLPPRCTVHTLH